jgi:hypothetical protein
LNDLCGSSDEVESNERDNLAWLAGRLHEARPVPAPAFVSRLRHAVIDLQASGRESPWRVRARIAGWAFAGSLLLLLGAIGAAGAGPFGG